MFVMQVHWEKDPTPLYKAGAHPLGIDAEHAHKVSHATLLQPSHMPEYSRVPLEYSRVCESTLQIGLDLV